jgi:hypothetical protein
MTNNPSILPEATRMSVRSALKLNVWAAVAVLAAFVSRLLLGNPAYVTGWSRVAVALLPLPPALLYVGTLWRWARSLDEMQRRIQLEAVCFGTLAVLLVTLAADLLRTAESVPGMNFGWEGYFVFTFFFYALGLARANRRYR